MCLLAPRLIAVKLQTSATGGMRATASFANINILLTYQRVDSEASVSSCSSSTATVLGGMVSSGGETRVPCPRKHCTENSKCSVLSPPVAETVKLFFVFFRRFCNCINFFSGDRREGDGKIRHLPTGPRRR